MIAVSKLCVSAFLKNGKQIPFLIPEYQRPYAWEEEQIDALFNDIWDFSGSQSANDKNGDYFLGCIVSYENEKGQQEIIDGQQRLTSLFLLLRAIYTNLQGDGTTSTKEAQHFMREIEKRLWDTNKLTGEVDFQHILITSDVIDNAGNEILRKILETGQAEASAKDNYSANYRQFQNLYKGKCSQDPLQIYNFIYALLNQAILLPITADSQDTALTIFSTLNNRGLPLSDADIFKAKMYGHCQTAEEKANFIEVWKKLDTEAQEAGESMQRLFYYYMFYLRAKEGDYDTTTPGLRKYYSDKKFKRLYEPSVLENLSTILNLWKVINQHQDIPEETWDNNKDILKALDLLTSYSNEFWKYPVITYYLCHHQEQDFDQHFLLFLRYFAGELITHFLATPTINAVKSDIMKLNIQILQKALPDYHFKPIDTNIQDRIKTPHYRMVPMLLKVYAYNYQSEILPDKWQIEHILPQKWQKTFFPADVSDNEIWDKIEHLGNKTPFEKKLNIVASNNYFGQKQAKYKESNIEVTRRLSEMDTTQTGDWTLQHIDQRDKEVSDEIFQTLQKWEKDYFDATAQSPTPYVATKEDLKLLEELRAKGLIK